MKKYILGNWMRGGVEGQFESLDEAWEWLSDRFLMVNPAEQGRHVHLYVYEPNPYGSELGEVKTMCKSGVTSLYKHYPIEEVFTRCKESSIPWTSL